jgi:uncharacterized protein
MNTAEFRFHPSLDFFLHPVRQGTPFTLTFRDSPAVKHLIEALGVPHVEVGIVLADRQPVKLSHRVQPGEHIEVHPAPDEFPDEACFLLDSHLGRLAAYLRMLGFDSLYRNDYDDEEMIALLREDPRILLTRDRRLLMRKAVQRGFCLRSLEPREQLREVVRRYALAGRAEPFRRCLRCNTRLQPVSKADILERLEPLTRLYYDEFRLCPACGRVYWQGSHYQRMTNFINQVGGGG